MSQIRIAQPVDLESIVSIYNFAVRSGFETADTRELQWPKRISWFKSHDRESYPIFVYEEDGVIAGWICISPYRPGRQALRYTVEISYYVHPDFKRKGFGSKLVIHAISEAKKRKFKSLFAITLDRNDASIQLLLKHGFSQWGHLPNIADFDGKECGQVYYGLRILK